MPGSAKVKPRPRASQPKSASEPGKEAARSKRRREEQNALISKLDGLLDCTGYEKDYRSTLKSGTSLQGLLKAARDTIKKIKGVGAKQAFPPGRAPSAQDSTRPGQVSPGTMTQGMRSARCLAVMAINLSETAIVEWNKGMERVSVPEGVAKVNILPSLVDHIGPQFGQMLTQLTHVGSNSADPTGGGRNVDLTFNLLGFIKYHKPDRTRAVFLPVTFSHVSWATASERTVVMFASDITNVDLSLPPLPESGAVTGTWKFCKEPMLSVENDDMTTPLGLLEQLADNEQLHTSASIGIGTLRSTLFQVVKNSAPLLKNSAYSVALELIRTDLVCNCEDEILSQSVTIQLPKILGGFRFSPLFRFHVKADGVLRKIKGWKHIAISLYIADYPKQRVKHDWAVSLVVWWYKDDEIFTRLKAAENQLWRNMEDRDNTELPLDGLTHSDCRIEIRRDIYFGEGGDKAHFELWTYKRDVKSAGRKHSYSAIKVGPPDREMEMDSIAMELGEEAHLWFATSPVLGGN